MTHGFGGPASGPGKDGQLAKSDTLTMQDFLRRARKRGASDVHIVMGIPPAYRVHGEIVLDDSPVLTADAARELTFEMLSDEQRDVLRDRWELCFSMQHEEFGRFRVTCYYHGHMPELAIRLCNDTVPTREELGLPPIVDELCTRQNGLVLVTGPTGMGKTTTLNYMINRINSERRCKIVTIEDPIEFVHRHNKAIVVQQEVGSDVKSFPDALRHVLRQDPDVICIGEMRDLETVGTALIAAETGHLVMATAHTPNAAQTVERIISVFPAEQQNQVIAQMASSLQGIVAQVLLPKAREKGRLLATEILLANNAVRSVIRENALHKLEATMETGKNSGMRTMDTCLRDLYHRGLVTYEVAAPHARDPRRLNELRRSGGSYGNG